MDLRTSYASLAYVPVSVICLARSRTVATFPTAGSNSSAGKSASAIAAAQVRGHRGERLVQRVLQVPVGLPGLVDPLADLLYGIADLVEPLVPVGAEVAAGVVQVLRADRVRADVVKAFGGAVDVVAGAVEVLAQRVQTADVDGEVRHAFVSPVSSKASTGGPPGAVNHVSNQPTGTL